MKTKGDWKKKKSKKSGGERVINDKSDNVKLGYVHFWAVFGPIKGPVGPFAVRPKRESFKKKKTT